MNNSQLINQTSGDVEFGSPPRIVEAARSLMGVIDLDPASSKEFNENIKAVRYYDKVHDGLSYPWGTQDNPSHVWMNHPFHAGWRACDDKCKRKTCKKRGYHVYEDIPGNAEWINKLVGEYEHGRVCEACMICFAATSEEWFQPLLRYPQCFLAPRTNYYLPDGTLYQGVTKGSVVTYFGIRVAGFREYFRPHGQIKIAI